MKVSTESVLRIFGITVAFVVLYMSCLGEHSLMIESAVRTDREIKIEAMRDMVAEMRDQKPLCSDGFTDFPCWKQASQSIRDLVAKGSTYYIDVRSFKETFTLVDIGVTEEELQGFERAHEEAYFGMRYDSLKDIRLCTEDEYRCWEKCGFPNSTDPPKWVWGEQLTILAHDAQALNLTQYISITHDAQGHSSSQTVPLAVDEIDELRQRLAQDCVTGLFSILINYPESGDFNMTPNSVVDALHRHEAVVMESGYLAFDSQQQIEALRSLAYKHWGSALVRKLKQMRDYDECTFPDMDAAVTKFFEFAEGSKLKLSDFGTARDELERLRGIDPAKLSKSND